MLLLLVIIVIRMGIPGLLSCICESYPEAFDSLNRARKTQTNRSNNTNNISTNNINNNNSNQFDHVYFDMNNMFYKALSKAKLILEDKHNYEIDTEIELNCNNNNDSNNNNNNNNGNDIFGVSLSLPVALFFQCLEKEVDQYIRVVAPAKSIMFAVDGKA